MACGTLGGFLLTWPLGWLSDRLDRRIAIIGAAVTAAVTLLIIVGVVPKQAPPWILYLCVAIFGGTIVPTYSVVMDHVNDSVGKDEFVVASGGLLIVQGAGAVAGPDNEDVRKVRLSSRPCPIPPDLSNWTVMRVTA